MVEIRDDSPYILALFADVATKVSLGVVQFNRVCVV